MPSTNTPAPSPKVDSRSAIHEPFSWIADDAKAYPMADFVALTMDACNGIRTCLELVHASDLDREAAEDDNDVTPVINAHDSGRLLRLALVTAALLSGEAERKIERINADGAKRTNSAKGASHA